VVTGVRVEVGKSALVNVSWQLRNEETVRMSSTGRQLQTLDANMGNVVDFEYLSQCDP